MIKLPHQKKSIKILHRLDILISKTISVATLFIPVKD